MSFSVGDVLAALAYAGAGGGMASIGVAVISSRSGKAEARAHAADLITNAAGSLADRLDRINTTLEQENIQMRMAINALADVMDELKNLLPTEGAREKAKGAIRAARLATHMSGDPANGSREKRKSESDRT